MPRRLVVVLAFICTAGAAAAQTAGSITGHVSDPSGGSIAGATVTLTDVSTSASRNAATTAAGDYSFPSVPPGNYTIKVEASGFKVTQSAVIPLQVEQALRQDFALEIGQLSQSVEVGATADLVQSENSTVGTVIENRSIEQLPLNGREYLNLVALAPNTNTLSPPAGQAQSREGGDRSNQSISVGGQRIMFDYYTLDGVDNTDPDFNSYVVLPSIDALQEFKVQTGIYPAQYGHEATQVNVLTKSGGNDYHGALFEFLRNDAMDSLPFAFTSKLQPKQPFKWNDYGFVLDGPVRIPWLFNGQDRLFFMSNYEALRQRQQFQAIYSVPTAAMQGGDFSGYSATIYDPSTKQPFAGNIIPSRLIDPISKKFLAYYPAANVATTKLANNYVQSNASPFNRDGFVLRMDFVESSKSQWSGRYSWGNENQSSQALSLAGSKILTGDEQYMGSNTRTFTPTLVNQATFGYTRIFNSIGTFLAFQTNVIDALGISNFHGGSPVSWGIPNVTFSGDGFSSIGDSTDGPYAITDNNLQFDDNLSWVHGSHTFSFGFEYMRQNFNQVGNQFSRGQFTFQANATAGPNLAGGDAFADFLLGDMYQSEASISIANAPFQRNDFAAWIDDTWKVTPKLTLSLGLRYELTPPWYDTRGDLFSVYLPHIDFSSAAPLSDYPDFIRQGNCTNPYAGISIVWPQINTICSNGLEGNRLMKTDYTDFAPRVGIAYSPNSNWVIRTGYGMFYVQDIGNAAFDLARNIAGRFRVNSSVGTPTLFWSNALAAGNGSSAQVTSPYALATSYSHRTGYTMQYELNVQRQLGNNLLVEVGYLGSGSRHLYGFQNANSAIPGTVGNALSRTPFKTFGVIQLVQDGGNANYNAGSISVTKRFSRGVSFITSYTYAKSIDDTSGIRVQGYDTLFPQNSDCITCDRGLSSFDVEHRFATSILYDVPVGRGRAVDVKNTLLNGIAGGWQIGGIWTVQSGEPQTITDGGQDRSGTGNGYDRPNATGISFDEPNPTTARWYNPAAFVEQPAGTYGNVGRNTAIGPAIFALDLDAHKEFHMFYKESHILQFRAEAFNALNHPVWSNPNANILSAGFGSITSTAIPMRQIQLALKYVF